MLGTKFIIGVFSEVFEETRGMEEILIYPSVYLTADKDGNFLCSQLLLDWKPLLLPLFPLYIDLSISSLQVLL